MPLVRPLAQDFSGIARTGGIAPINRLESGRRGIASPHIRRRSRGDGRTKSAASRRRIMTGLKVQVFSINKHRFQEEQNELNN